MLFNALLQRGFLVQKKGQNIYLTDNALMRDLQNNFFPRGVASDVKFLAKMLGQMDCGNLVESDNPGLPYRLTAFDMELTEEQIRILYTRDAIQVETATYVWKSSWNRFRKFPTGTKVPLIVIEPHVGLLVKALSAVGCSTWSSCEGHLKKNDLHVELLGSAHGAWANYLLEDALFKGIALRDLHVNDNCLTTLQYDDAQQLGSEPRKHQLWLDATRRQAIDLGLHIYNQRVRLSQERVIWIINATNQKEAFTLPVRK